MTDELREDLSAAQAYERDALHASFREVLNTVAGKRVVFWMLERCAVYRDAFDLETNFTNYTLGRQAAGRDVIAKLDEINPRLYPQMLLDIAEIKEVDNAAAKALTAKPEKNDDDQD